MTFKWFSYDQINNKTKPLMRDILYFSIATNTGNRANRLCCKALQWQCTMCSHLSAKNPSVCIKLPLAFRAEQSWQIRLPSPRALIRSDEKQSYCSHDNGMSMKEGMAGAAGQAKRIKSMSQTRWTITAERWPQSESLWELSCSKPREMGEILEILLAQMRPEICVTFGFTDNFLCRSWKKKNF